MITLYPYQKKLIDDVSRSYAAGTSKILLQLPTGGGKTVIFSALIQRYLSRFTNHKALVLVDRIELLKQARETLQNGFGIHSDAIAPRHKTNYSNNVFVGMVETFYNKIKKNNFIAKKFNLLIIDECHMGNFHKMYEYFDGLIIGVTATPISANKKIPLNSIYQKILTGPQINELIGKSLVQNITHSDSNSKDVKFSVKRGEYDNAQMSQHYSKNRNVLNTVEMFQRFGAGKTIVFNCSIEHSNLVNEAFLANGYNSRSIDSKDNDYRNETIEWFKKTQNAILHNVGIATKGFDVKDINTVIVNKKTLSLTLWLQMCGRGGRKAEGKDHFTIIDLGGNAYDLGDWNANRDWEYIFNNPDKPPTGGGLPPMKHCEGCEALIHAATMICPHCGHEHEHNYDIDRELAMDVVTKGIDINKFVKINAQRGYKETKTFFDILDTQIKMTKNMNVDQDVHLMLFEGKVKEWLNSQDKRYTSWWKDFAKEQLTKRLN